jgi:hypothetical protein
MTTNNTTSSSSSSPSSSSSSPGGRRRGGVAIDYDVVVVVPEEEEAGSNRPTTADASSIIIASPVAERPFLSHKNKIRLLYFLFRFSTGIPNPFMTLYMQHVGLFPDTIGTLQAIRPLVTMLSAPIWGGLADGTGRKKLVLIVSCSSFVVVCVSACACDVLLT